MAVDEVVYEEPAAPLLRPWPLLGAGLALIGAGGPWAFGLPRVGGLFTAVVSVAPPNGPAPWLAMQVGTRFYRPWLDLTNLHNGYHFYAPEPGPVALLWFRVEYADGAARWRRLPDHERSLTGLQ